MYLYVFRTPFGPVIRQCERPPSSRDLDQIRVQTLQVLRYDPQIKAYFELLMDGKSWNQVTDATDHELCDGSVFRDFR